MAAPIRDFQLTDHAIFEMRRRGISPTIVQKVLMEPQPRGEVRSGRDVLQSMIPFEGKAYLVRVFVDVDQTPAKVVTVYRTSNVAKYWRTEP